MGFNSVAFGIYLGHNAKLLQFIKLFCKRIEMTTKSGEKVEWDGCLEHLTEEEFISFNLYFCDDLILLQQSVYQGNYFRLEYVPETHSLHISYKVKEGDNHPNESYGTVTLEDAFGDYLYDMSFIHKGEPRLRIGQVFLCGWMISAGYVDRDSEESITIPDDLMETLMRVKTEYEQTGRIDQGCQLKLVSNCCS